MSDCQNSPWSEENVALLRSLHEQHKTGSQIAAQIGITRNAVIGKLHRLGLKGQPRPRKPRPRKPRPWKPVVPDIFLATEVEPPTPSVVHAVPDNAVSFMDLESHHCRWPFERVDGERVYCGKQQHGERPYCLAHYRMAYTRRQEGSREEVLVARALARRVKQGRAVAMREEAA